ncbi:hypothetical protein B4134_3914 [Bacillus safensis]|nr:hypothetical protein B4134_3914 [Bacillus safensis]
MIVISPIQTAAVPRSAAELLSSIFSFKTFDSFRNISSPSFLYFNDICISLAVSIYKKS